MEVLVNGAICDASKPLKPFQGLKPQFFSEVVAYSYSFKASKTLSGIETCVAACKPCKYKEASKPLKPFQGLKQSNYTLTLFLEQRSFKASKTLSGIETAIFSFSAMIESIPATLQSL